MADAKLGAAYVEFGGRTNKFSAALDFVHRNTLGAGGKLGSAGLSAGNKFLAGLSSGLKGATGLLSGPIGSILKLAGVAGMAYPALSAAARGIGSIATAGSDLNEIMSATEQTFGASSGVVTGAAQEMADKFGVVKGEFLQGAIAIGAMGQGMGKTEAEAAAFGVQFTKLAADVSSFRNIPVAEALQAIQSGLSGEAEPLKRFGILVSEADVASAGWAMGLARVGTELTTQQKATARAALIMQGFNKAQGDLERTQGGVANRMKKATGTIANSWANLGAAVQPAAVRVLEAVSGGMGGAIDWLTSRQDVIASWADAAVTGLGSAASYLMSWGPTVGGVFSFVYGYAEAAFGYIARAFAGVSGWVSGNADVFAAWGSGVMSVVQTVGDMLGGWGNAVEAVFTGAGVWVKAFGDAIAFTTRYAGAILGDMGLTITQWGLDAMAVVSWLTTGLARFGTWLGSEWVNLFRDAFVGAMTIADNFATNLLQLISEIGNFIQSGFTAEFDTSKLNVFSGLTEGIENKTAAMPEFGALEFDRSGTDAARAALWEQKTQEEIARTAPEAAAPEAAFDEEGYQAFLSEFDPMAAGEDLGYAFAQAMAAESFGPDGPGSTGGPGSGGGLMAGDVMGPDAEAKKAEVLGLTDLGKKVQEAIGGGDDTPKKQLKTQEQMLEVMRAQEKLLAKPRGAVFS